ncbi:hypothetical protein [Primorskyibacter sp. 2E233]|uniref:hypothetical protein n=1 Tax=Primorskyibacter sp. 2E233 TaxID=3413431 RepID=UPI003BF042E5
MSDALRLFGTEVPDTPFERITLGPLSFSLQDGALRHIRMGDQELIRGIAFLVRDRDWGTLSPRLTEVSRQIGETVELVYEAGFEQNGARLDARLEISASTTGLCFKATGQASGGFETNRAGFTVLHPARTAGSPAVVRHSDGTEQSACFPVLIDPWQPFMDITRLSHQAGAWSVTCAFEGDTFEMEDQRQWGDASFKTYNRPLALPWPYVLEDGAPFAQSVELTWRKAGDVFVPPAETLSRGAVFPQTALVLTAEDALRLARAPQDLALVLPQRLLCHVDAALGGVDRQVAAFAGLQKAVPDIAYDLELICLLEQAPEEELSALAAMMRAEGLVPDSVLICPSVDRQSTPPGSEWPDCPPLEDIHRAASKAFAGALHGGGMVSFFPELNRKRPPVEMLDFVSHGLCPIVHAADDLSVMETLETISHITRSAQAIIGERAYRIGPATIAMRQNPYGTRTIPNPEQRRLCMADDDPRHRGAFGAAYVIGLATALASAGAVVWTPAGFYGPRGVHPDWPVTKAIKVLSGLAGAPVIAAQIEGGLAKLHLGDTRLTANLTPVQNGDLGPYEWTQT